MRTVLIQRPLCQWTTQLTLFFASFFSWSRNGCVFNVNRYAGFYEDNIQKELVGGQWYQIQWKEKRHRKEKGTQNSIKRCTQSLGHIFLYSDMRYGFREIIANRLQLQAIEVVAVLLPRCRYCP